MATTGWIKATRSGSSGSCVEFRGIDDGGTQKIQMRDSKNPDGPRLTFDRNEVDAFLDGRAKGEFVHLLHDLL